MAETTTQLATLILLIQLIPDILATQEGAMEVITHHKCHLTTMDIKDMYQLGRCLDIRIQN